MTSQTVIDVTWRFFNHGFLFVLNASFMCFVYCLEAICLFSQVHKSGLSISAARGYIKLEFTSPFECPTTVSY
jgi:hypothetical protein